MAAELIITLAVDCHCCRFIYLYNKI